MPALSAAQRRLMAIAEHHPGQVYAKNRGVLGMSKGQMHDFAATKEKGLPQHVKPKKQLTSLKHRLKQRKKGA